ncbi:hypothetical protein PISMIDRAFT_115463, partial [Pisolithus microcarpus 441]
YFTPFQSFDPTSLLVYIVTAVLHLLCGISIDHCAFVLSGLRLVLRSQTPSQPGLVDGVPRDIRTVLKELSLLPVTKAFNSLCREPARESSASDVRRNAPIRLYIYHDFKEWLARLHSRLEIEKHLERNLRLPYNKRHLPDIYHDIWDAPALQDFQGPDGKRFISPGCGEGRYIFSLNMDGFNPFQRRQAGKKSSCGAIYMICLNLPPELRYRPENIFLVGIIPGPHEPSLHQINHLLRPLVDDLLIAWHHGIRFSQTALHPAGRTVRCAVVPLLTWPRITLQEHLSIAEQWRDAVSDAARRVIYDKHGIRWTELLRLPYWDPTKFTLLDTMHTFLLVLIQKHCREIWGMDDQLDDGPGATYDKLIMNQPPSYDQVQNGLCILREGSVDDLRRLSEPLLRFMCRELQVRFGGRKGRLVEQLINLVSPKYLIPQNFSISPALPSSVVQQPHVSAQLTISSNTAGLTTRQAPADDGLQEALEVLETAPSIRALCRLRKSLLVALCIAKLGHDLTQSVDGTPHESSYSKLSKYQLAERLNDWRKTVGIVDENGRLEGVPSQRSKPQKKVKKSRVLGRTTLGFIWEDFNRLHIPSWVAPVPRKAGSTRHGKLSADQYQTLFTVNLPFTLGRLWGTKEPDSVEYKMFANFMDLVSAVKLATRRTMTADCISKYRFHMKRYLRTLLDLYPGLCLSPTHHICLHLADLLENFGLVHAWRCFPFERYNGMLQQIPTNGKHGELEQTMLHRFCMGQQLRALMSSEFLPHNATSVLVDFDRIFQTSLRGTLFNDILAFEGPLDVSDESSDAEDFTPMPEDQCHLLHGWLSTHAMDYDPTKGVRPYASVHKSIRHCGETYAVASASLKNSRILFRMEGNDHAVGVIQYIFSHRRVSTNNVVLTQTFLVVSQYAELPLGLPLSSTYEGFPDAGVHLVSTSLLPSAQLLTTSDIVCHFAHATIRTTDMESEVLYVQSLDKVSTRKHSGHTY